MKIEFDTATASFGDAEALAAMLVARYGAGVVPASYERVGDVERATGSVVINRTTVSEPKAPDGYPVQPPADNAHVAPGAEPFPTTGDAPQLERDSNGIPWDERIHASTKTTTANGQWTRRRNTPDATFDAVMAELKAANTARTMEAAAGLTVQAPPPPAEPSAAEAFAAPVATVPAPPAPSLPTGAAPSFLEIMQIVTPAQRDGKLDKAKLDELLAAAGIEGGVPKLVTAPADARATLAALLSAHLS